MVIQQNIWVKNIFHRPFHSRRREKQGLKANKQNAVLCVLCGKIQLN